MMGECGGCMDAFHPCCAEPCRWVCRMRGMSSEETLVFAADPRIRHVGLVFGDEVCGDAWLQFIPFASVWMWADVWHRL